MIRKPGEDFVLTDAELLAAPPKLLSPEQRRRRRLLRNNIAKAKTRSNREKRRANGGAKIIYCRGTKKNGEKCRGFALTGAKHCAAHLDDEEKERLGVRFEGGRLDDGMQTTANPVQLAKAVVEKATTKVLNPYLRTIGLEVAGFDEENEPVLRDLGPDAGLKLFGESKEGVIKVSKHPDLAGQIAAMEKLQDRVYGRPRQTTVLEGGVQPIKVQPVRSVERSQAVSELLAQTGAVGKPLPASPDIVLPETSEGRVIPLRTDQD